MAPNILRDGQQLAPRLGVTQSALAQLETREAKQAVTLDALARAADVLECDVVYALVPRQPLADMVAAQARRVARLRNGLPAADRLTISEILLKCTSREWSCSS